MASLSSTVMQRQRRNSRSPVQTLKVGPVGPIILQQQQIDEAFMKQGNLVRWLILFAILAVYLPASHAQASARARTDLHDREFWRQVARNHYVVPQRTEIFPLAKELSGYLASPDPELRDDLAYSILASWIVRQNQFSHAELISLADDWQRNLTRGIGESSTDTVLLRSFSALSLASLAERDLKDPFLDAERFGALLNAALDYLRDEKDLRGFDERQGWIHATAHTADLLAALAGNRRFEKREQHRVLDAIAQRLSTANAVFTMGEQDRLANATVAVMDRGDFDTAAWKAWLTTLNNEDQSVWNDSPPKWRPLIRFQNDSYFLRALVAQASLRSPSTELAASLKPVLALLSRR